MVSSFFLLATASAALANQPVAALALQLTPNDQEVSQGEPILVELRLRNQSDRTISVDLGESADEKWFITVKSPHRAAVPGQLEETPGQLTFGGQKKLAPGDEYRTTLVLNRWALFYEPGEYEVTVGLPIGPPEGPRVIAAQDVTKVVVGPRDPEALEKVCSDFATQATDGSREKAQVAARALSQVWDELCLPALRRLLQKSSFARDEAVTGLARVGTRKAIQVLVDSWKDLDQGARSRALWEFDRRGGAEPLRSALREAGLEVGRGQEMGGLLIETTSPIRRYYGGQVVAEKRSK